MDETIRCIIGGVILVAVAYAGLWMGGIMVDNFPASHTTHEQQISSESMVSLSEGSGASGHFFLGSGSISNVDYFYYYVGTDSFHKKKVPSDYTTIYMDENEQPYISTIGLYERMCRRNGECTIDQAFYTPGYDNSGHHGPQRYEIHVPNGTIIREFSLGGSQ
jgi:hypothetical protein